MGFYYLDNLLSKGFRIQVITLPFPYKLQGDAGVCRYAIRDTVSGRRGVPRGRKKNP
jgi:hypothetical protein